MLNGMVIQHDFGAFWVGISVFEDGRYEKKEKLV
jgi:hypothetical protein